MSAPQKTTIRPRTVKAGAAAGYLGISRRGLHDWTKAGRIPYHRVSSRTILYSLADLDAFLDNCKIGGE